MKKQMVIKKGSHGELVKILQELLKIEVDGIFGENTRKSVIYFQKQNKLTSDGIVGPLTWKKLGFDPLELRLDTDREQYENWIETYHLPPGQYINKETSKQYIMLHHTAGRHNPYKTIDHWANDNRGRVGTNYVIGGKSTNGRDLEFDGKILRAINDEYYGWHIGPGGSFYMKEHSLSIEICSAGGLKNINGVWKTWYEEIVEDNEVSVQKHQFRGYRAFQKYSDEQLKSTKATCLFLANKHNIDIREGLHNMLKSNKNAFDFNEDIYNGKVKGLISHTNVRTDKSDIFPQDEMIDMLLSL